MKYLKALPYILIVVLCLMLGTTWMSNARFKSELNDIMSLNEVTLQELDTERIEHKTTMQLLSDADAYSSILEQQIADLKARPNQIKYVLRTETIMQAGPVVTVKELPEDYTFRLQNGLAVAAIDKQEDKYDLLTYDLSLRGQVVMAKSKANVSIQASSSENPDSWVEVPVELRVVESEKRTTFEPHIGVGLTAGYPWHVSGALWTTVVHLPSAVDLGGLAVLANNQEFQAGLIPIAYNVGDPLPVFTNIWVAPMATLDLQGQPGASILVGGKL